MTKNRAGFATGPASAREHEIKMKMLRKIENVSDFYLLLLVSGNVHPPPPLTDSYSSCFTNRVESKFYYSSPVQSMFYH